MLDALYTLAAAWLWLLALAWVVMIVDIPLGGRISRILLLPFVERSSKKREKAASWKVESGRVFPTAKDRKS